MILLARAFQNVLALKLWSQSPLASLAGGHLTSSNILAMVSHQPACESESEGSSGAEGEAACVLAGMGSCVVCEC